jgi:hypothetical protein
MMNFIILPLSKPQLSLTGRRELDEFPAPAVQSANLAAALIGRQSSSVRDGELPFPANRNPYGGRAPARRALAATH